VPLAFAVVQHPAHGAFALAQDGTVAFTPALDWSGTDIARVSVCDGTTGPVTVTITLSVLPVVDPLRLLVVLDRSTLETWGAELAPHVYAPDGRPVTFALAGQPLRGSVTLGPDGRVDYTRSVGFLAGVDYIPVVASDGQSTVALMLKVVVTDEDGEDVPPVAAYISRIAVAADAAGGRTAVLDIDCPAWPILQTCTDLMVADWQDVPELGDAEPRVTVAAGGDGSYAFTLQLDAGRVRFFRVRLP
jgi:hypothetical protein